MHITRVGSQASGKGPVDCSSDPVRDDRLRTRAAVRRADRGDSTGDVVWFPPDEKHWHAASPTTAVTHIAIQERRDGKAVDWMEQVTDSQYERGSTAK